MKCAPILFFAIFLSVLMAQVKQGLQIRVTSPERTEWFGDDPPTSSTVRANSREIVLVITVNGISPSEWQAAALREFSLAVGQERLSPERKGITSTSTFGGVTKSSPDYRLAFLVPRDATSFTLVYNAASTPFKAQGAIKPRIP